LITTLDTVSWAKPLSLGNAEFVETGTSSSFPTLYIVSNVRNNGFGFGKGFGSSFASPYQFVVLQSDPVPPSPGPGDTFGGTPPVSVPEAVYTFPQPNLSFDPAAALDPSTGLLHILGTRNTPTTGDQSSSQLSDIVKFTYDINTRILAGPFVIVSSIGGRVRGSFDIAVLPTGNTIAAMSLTEPALATGNVSSVSVSGGVATVNVAPMSPPLVAGQWVLLDSLVDAAFLNGQLLQVLTATATQFTAATSAGNYPLAADTGTVAPAGSSLLAVELDKGTNLPVPGTAAILDSSPARTGNTFDGVSLLADGNTVELYYQSHPKVFSFSDQVFTINLAKRDYPPLSPPGAAWNSPTTLTTFTARYSDNHLTVLADSAGHRYMSLTYWSQLNHPEGIVGSVLVGRKSLDTPIPGFGFAFGNDFGLFEGVSPWFFHPTLGTTMGGSLVQSTLSIAQDSSVSLVYLLQPFAAVSNPPALASAAWPLQAASVDPGSLGLTNVPGFYNTRNFTWLRGTKSLVDNQSLWAVVGESEIASTAAGELHTIPTLALPPPLFTVQVANFAAYFENVGVVYYPSLAPLTEVDTDPQRGQYTVDTSTGMYTFNEADAGRVVAVSYSYIASILPVYASLYNVPPIAEVVPASATVWRGGSYYATDVSPVSGFATFGDTITVACPNDFAAGQQVAIYGFVRAENQFLNGVTLKVSAATSAYFTASFANSLVFGFGFGINFGSSFNSFTSVPNDTGFAAALIPGTLVLSAAGSADADNDAMQYVWSENDPDLAHVSLSAAGALAAVDVASAVGAARRVFDVGVAVIDLFPDLVTQRHPALVVEDVAVSTPSSPPASASVLTVTFSAPTGALVPIAGERAMLYGISSAAIAESLNDQVITLIAGTDATTLVAEFPLGFGYDFGFDFGSMSFPTTAVTGSAISQHQFQQTQITVPANVAPLAFFPSPQWGAGNVLAATAARNTGITITPGAVSDPTTQFPVIYSGLTDPDDVPAYSWSQVSGTSVVLVGASSSAPVIHTNGVNLNGEALVFSLTLNDGINPPSITEFTIPVAAYVFNSSNQDKLQLSRSVFSASAPVTGVSIFGGIGTITASNSFSAGQTVWFGGLTGAAFLNGGAFAVLPTGFGQSFSASFGGSSLSSTQFQIASDSLPNYGPLSESGTAYSAMPISMRNTAQTWSPLDISILFSNLRSVKRTSVLDGSDRYIVISPHSVLVYGVFPSATPAAVLLRKLFLPNSTAASILDAVHTEQDYTLVFDTEGRIWRYTTAPFVNTDNPDTFINVSNYTSLSFLDSDLAAEDRILTTQSFGNQRVLVMSGEDGALLLQVNTTTLAVMGKLEFDVASNNLYGASKVQFVRWVNMDNLNSGKILLGTILNQAGTITSLAVGAGTFRTHPVGAKTLLVACANSFSVGDAIVLSGLSATATSRALNGLTATVIDATPTAFIASFDPASLGLPAIYGPTSDTGIAQSQNSGSTYETLIDLAANQIIGTFDKSKLRNQFVETGEIMFDPDDAYSGGPAPPELLQPITVNFGGLPNIVITWQQQRPDLINSYTVQFAIENPFAASVPAAAPYTFQVPVGDQFTADAGVLDTTVNAPLARTIATDPLTGQYHVDESTRIYTFNQAQAGHSLAITVRQGFQTLQIVNSGNQQTVYEPLPTGRTYFFRVQAIGLDGTSGFSNVESITI